MLVINPSVVITDALFKWLELIVEEFNVDKFNGSLVCAILPIVVMPPAVERLIPEPAARLGLMSPSIVPVTLRSPLISTASRLPFSVIIGNLVPGFDKKKFMSIDELSVVPTKFRILFARANEVVSPVLLSSIYNRSVSTVLAFTVELLIVLILPMRRFAVLPPIIPSREILLT